MKKIIFFFTAYLFTLSPIFAAFEHIPDNTTISLLNPHRAQQQIRRIRLNNGMEAYLISDPLAPTSSAALSVRKGYWDDPDDIPGMAHFVEHMLFLGTEKYPKEGEFHTFVQENHGLTNAFTSNDHTCYGFNIAHAAFTEGLDRFAHFFIHPLFHPSGVGSRTPRYRPRVYKKQSVRYVTTFFMFSENYFLKRAREEDLPLGMPPQR